MNKTIRSYFDTVLGSKRIFFRTMYRSILSHDGIYSRVEFKKTCIGAIIIAEEKFGGYSYMDIYDLCPGKPKYFVTLIYDSRNVLSWK